jgi:hypothetical protein
MQLLKTNEVYPKADKIMANIINYFWAMKMPSMHFHAKDTIIDQQNMN